MEKLLTNRNYVFLFSIIGIPYIMGLFVPLMDSDAAHHADIALHMYLNNDFVNLVDQGKDYLDKPHLLFWLSAISYHIFGVTGFAYKFPSFLFSIGALWATYKCGKILYNAEVGKLAALILASAQAFMLACMDVRMDALLSANIILAIWQLLESVTAKKWYNTVLAGLFMAMAFSTKGMVGIVMPGIAIVFYLLYRRDFKQLFHPRWITTAVCTAVFMMPVVYCYYLQYDLHPEKEIRGMTNISGVKFILWGQNVERLQGTDWGHSKIDYSFYFHTLLWAFLPWSLIAYYAIGNRLSQLWRSKFAYQAGKEGLTIATIVLIFILISSSHFQLPQYLNILFPLFALLSAAKLADLHTEHKFKTILILEHIQTWIAILISVLAILLCIWAFPVTHIPVAILGVVLLVGLGRYIIKRDHTVASVVIISVLTAAFVNVLLNGSFYPEILRYQGGSNLAAEAKELPLQKADTYIYNVKCFAFDFYTASLSTQILLDDIKNKAGKKNMYILTNGQGLDSLRNAAIPVTIAAQSDQYHVTTLTLKFINPATRKNALDKFYLLQVNH
jgi:4-amino-4-deoxy-L-arabinose transferase-like glycosyltransferase